MKVVAMVALMAEMMVVPKDAPWVDTKVVQSEMTMGNTLVVVMAGLKDWSTVVMMVDSMVCNSAVSRVVRWEMLQAVAKAV